MKNTLLMTLMFAALGPSAFAASGVPQMIVSDSDPLSRQILTKTAQANGGVTAAVRLASGQVVDLKLTDISSAPFPSALAPAAKASSLGLKPAAGLAPKTAKAKAKKSPRKAVEQLKSVSSNKNWTTR